MTEEKQVQEQLLELSTQLARQARDLEIVKDELHRAGALNVAVEEGRKIEASLRGYVDERVKTLQHTLAVVGAVISIVLGAVAFLGFNDLVPEAVSNILGKRVEDIVAEAQNQNRTQLELTGQLLQHTIDQHMQLKENSLIVLQTDFGSTSPYMGILKGAIYAANPRARIDVISQEIPEFDTRAAAWNLQRAIGAYPKETIFVAVTGAPTREELVNPSIMRTKDQYTLVGYTNGVFDFVVSEHELEKSFNVQWNTFQDQLTTKKGTPKTSDTEGIGIAKILGTIAGTLSLGDTPWGSRDMAFWKDVARPSGFYKRDPELARLIAQPHKTDGEVTRVSGAVMEIDTFGNVTTNISTPLLAEILDVNAIDSPGLPVEAYVSVRAMGSSAKINKPLRLKIALDYGAVRVGEDVGVIDGGFLQLARNLQNFANVHKISLKDRETPPRVVICTKKERCQF